MKNLIISLAAASVFFFIGCQENSITDPIANQPVEKPQVGIPDTYIHGIIPIETVLSDPYPVMNSFYRIIGQMEYDLRVFLTDPMLPVPQRYLSLHLETNAELQYFCTFHPFNEEDNLAGFISDVAEDYVPLGGNFVSLLEKTFTIQGREDGMVLKVRFNVTNDRIEINAMWLALPNNNVATIINHY